MRRSRGNHVIYHHPEAYAIVQALKARGVVGDFRMPDCIRLGIAPIYLSFADIVNAVAHLRAVMEGREWAAPSFQRARRGDVSSVSRSEPVGGAEAAPVLAMHADRGVDLLHHDGDAVAHVARIILDQIGTGIARRPQGRRGRRRCGGCGYWRYST